MKPWLLNILACPMDKHHPLEAYFFSWETSEEEMAKHSAEAGVPSDDNKKKYEQLAKQLLDGTVSPKAIGKIKDLTGSVSSVGLLAVAVDSLHRVENVPDVCEETLLEESSQDLDSLHRYFNLVEVDAGLLFCPECSRWYPIGSAVETIPEMLPDDLRDKERDLEWLEKWKTLIPLHVLESGKPYTLKDKIGKP